MTKSFILLASIILTSFSSFCQIEQTVPVRSISSIQSSYRGCCTPVYKYAPARCTPLPVVKIEKSEDVLEITDPELDGLGASPNPTRGFLTISVPASLIGYELQVIDMTGRFVGNAVPITGGIEHLTIEGESGVYLISIRTETEIITKRILLQTN